MNLLTHFADPAMPERLAAGAVGVMPTDTLYGLVASAYVPEAVERVYALKQRSAHKPCIILVDSPERIIEFGVSPEAIAQVTPYWPGPLSVIFESFDPAFGYLHRDLGNPPFRVPAHAQLREFLARSGPLIAPSANLENEPPAATIPEAEQMFGETIDFYIDGGRLQGEPSTVVKADDEGQLEVIRQGQVKIMNRER